MLRLRAAGCGRGRRPRELHVVCRGEREQFVAAGEGRKRGKVQLNISNAAEAGYNLVREGETDPLCLKMGNIAGYGMKATKWE